MAKVKTITINRADGFITVNNRAEKVDCSGLPAWVSVIQWAGGAGHIEFVQQGCPFMPNCKIVDFTPYQYLVEAFDQAVIASDEAAASRAAATDASIAERKDRADAVAAHRVAEAARAEAAAKQEAERAKNAPKIVEG